MRRFAFAAIAAAAWLCIPLVVLADKVSDADHAFLSKDVQGARFELALAKAAQSKASSSKVRAYAQTIVQDHEQANAALMRLAKQEGVDPPGGITPKDAETLTKLNGLNGPAFDKAYLNEVTRINAEDETDADHEKSSTHDQRISGYIKKFSAMDAKHKKIGESLKKAGV